MSDPIGGDGRLIVIALVVFFVIRYMFSNRSTPIRLLGDGFRPKLANKLSLHWILSRYMLTSLGIIFFISIGRLVRIVIYL